MKEEQLDMFADRTSCHKRWDNQRWDNQFQLLLSSLANTLLETTRRTALALTMRHLQWNCCESALLSGATHGA